MEADLKTEPGEVRMTIQIKRAATGKVEEVELVGKIQKPLLGGQDNGSNT